MCVLTPVRDDYLQEAAKLFEQLTVEELSYYKFFNESPDLMCIVSQDTTITLAARLLTRFFTTSFKKKINEDLKLLWRCVATHSPASFALR